jgi:hypothetical protein
LACTSRCAIASVVTRKARGGEGQIEIRQVFEAEDFGMGFTPEVRAQEERWCAESEKLRQKK